jgi:hypothetical protein
MRVRLFDEFERTDPSPRGYEEDTFSFLNRVDQPFWQEIRDELERWYADYPDDEHGFGLRARFRKAAPAQHFGAWWELYLHRLFRCLGFHVEVEPNVVGGPGRDCTDAFPELAPLSEALRRRRLLLDGEVVCLNGEGDPDFTRLRARLRSAAREARLAAQRSPATFLAFDLLHLDGYSTCALAYSERRALLAELGLDGPRWWAPRSFGADEASALLEATKERGLEGVVAKRLDAALPARRTERGMDEVQASPQ